MSRFKTGEIVVYEYSSFIERLTSICLILGSCDGDSFYIVELEENDDSEFKFAHSGNTYWTLSINLYPYTPRKYLTIEQMLTHYSPEVRKAGIRMATCDSKSEILYYGKTKESL